MPATRLIFRSLIARSLIARYTLDLPIPSLRATRVLSSRVALAVQQTRRTWTQSRQRAASQDRR